MCGAVAVLPRPALTEIAGEFGCPQRDYCCLILEITPVFVANLLHSRG